MSCVHQLNLIPFPGGPGALFHEGQIGPSSLTHAASKALLSASRLSPRFIRLRSLVGKHLRQMAFFWGGTGTGRKIKQFLRVGFAVLYIVFSFMETIQGEEWGVMERIWGLNFLTTHLQEARNQETLILVSTLLLVHSGTLPHISVLLLSIVRRSWIGLSCLIGLL